MGGKGKGKADVSGKANKGKKDERRIRKDAQVTKEGPAESPLEALD